jgi:hypothetical protein
LCNLVLELVEAKVEARTTFDEELRGVVWVAGREGWFFGRTFGLVDGEGVVE